ncbi:hypothetical protein ACC754_38485, partial [Rhizobium johnstonii]
VTDSNNTSDSFNKTDTDFAVIDDVKDSNLGVAVHDLTFNLGDDFSFTLDVDSILNNSLTGAGNDSAFVLHLGVPGAILVSQMVRLDGAEDAV